MKKTIGSYEAKTNLPSILERVSKGECITITRRGQPIAIISPVPSSELVSLDEAVNAIIELRKKYSLKGVGLKKLIRDGRK